MAHVQRFLPALRAVSRTATMAATGYVGDSPLFLLDYLLRLLRVLVLLAIWRTLFAGKGSVGGVSLGAVLTYTVVAELFRNVLNCRTDLLTALWDGSIAVRVLRPQSLVAQFGAEFAGQTIFGLCLFSLPLLLVSPLLGVDPRPAGTLAAVLFVVSLALAVVVGLALEFLLATLMVVMSENVWVLTSLRDAVTTLLSGGLLPLALLPWGLGGVLAWLPFAATASAPLRIYTGTGEPVALLLLQVGWVVALWLLATALWRRSRERLVGYGG